MNASPVIVTLELSPPRVRVVLPRVLTANAVDEALASLPALLAPLASAPEVSLIVDTRALREGEDAALEQLGDLERLVGQTVQVMRVARLVASEALVADANAHSKAAGIDRVLQAFTDEAEAIAFLEPQ